MEFVDIATTAGGASGCLTGVGSWFMRYIWERKNLRRVTMETDEWRENRPKTTILNCDMNIMGLKEGILNHLSTMSMLSEHQWGASVKVKKCFDGWIEKSNFWSTPETMFSFAS